MTLSTSAFEGDDVGFGPLAFEVFLGLVELGLLEAVGGNDGNFLALEFVAAEDAHRVLGSRSTRPEK
jgi:hypothetical protein